MSRSNELSTAKKDKKDEFYTTLEDIELEMKNYRDQFKGKTIFCNCDDPYESNFFKYFAMNFNYLGLKKLIATCYDGSPFAGTQLSLFDFDNNQSEQKSKSAYKVEVTNIDDLNEDGAIDLQDVELLLKKPGVVKKLNGNGDFRSEECVDLLKEADIVITNPPFSLFREFVALLVEYNKKFLIIGNVNAITYKEIFPLIKNNKLWLGASIHSGDRKFYVPDDYPLNAAGCGTDKDGRRYIRVKGVRWFTNLDYKQRHEDLILYKKYYGHEEDYPKYDNYDAINVDSTADIPCDYFEKMGVPITTLDKFNPDQFEIVKFRKGDDNKDLAYTRERERESTAILQNHHQAENVTELSESQSHSLTNGTQINSKSLATSTLLESKKAEDISTEAESTAEYSSRENACNGLMGVPITFLDKFSPDQFEIIGITKTPLGNELRTKIYKKQIQHNPNGTTQLVTKANDGACLEIVGEPNPKKPWYEIGSKRYAAVYPRILIRRKRYEN